MIQFLIGQGHSFSDIKNYTPGQLGVFVKSAFEQKEDADKNFIVSTWIAHNADQKYIDKNIVKKKPKSITESPGFLQKVIKVKRAKPKENS